MQHANQSYALFSLTVINYISISFSVYTSGELKLTGNCLTGSRPLLSFDNSFVDHPHYNLLQELFTQVMENNFNLENIVGRVLFYLCFEYLLSLDFWST